jgi:hypothetical protein
MIDEKNAEEIEKPQEKVRVEAIISGEEVHKHH